MIEHFASLYNRPKYLPVREIVLTVGAVCAVWKHYRQDGTLITSESVHQSPAPQLDETEVLAVSPTARLVESPEQYFQRVITDTHKLSD